jgi:hypothetical protein
MKNGKKNFRIKVHNNNEYFLMILVRYFINEKPRGGLFIVVIYYPGFVNPRRGLTKETI